MLSTVSCWSFRPRQTALSPLLKTSNFLIRLSSLPNHILSRSTSRQKSSLHTSNIPLPSNCPTPQILTPHYFWPHLLRWDVSPPLPSPEPVAPGSLLRIVSRNLDLKSPGRAARASAAISHLEDVFGDPPPPLVIMLQEVHADSLSSMLSHPWIRDHFAVSESTPPKPFYRKWTWNRSTSTISESNSPQLFFTLLLVSRDLQAQTWFRVPLTGSKVDSDILVVDLAVSCPSDTLGIEKKILRLCTTTCEEQGIYGQLAEISALIKAPPKSSTQIVGGLVGGDMKRIKLYYNRTTHIDHVETVYDVDLSDVWEDTPPPTRRYPTQRSKNSSRLDKFHYTGSIEVVSLPEFKGKDLYGKIGILGRKLKTKIAVSGDDSSLFRFLRDPDIASSVYPKPERVMEEVEV